MGPRVLRRRVLAFVVLALASCDPFAGMGAHVEGQPFVASGAASNGQPAPRLKAFVDQPSHEERAALEHVIQNVLDIFADPSFQSEVMKQKEWWSRAECARGETQPLVVNATEIVSNVLLASYVNVHYVVNSFDGSLAETRAGEGTAILRSQLERWSKSDEKEKAAAIGTVAHELAHLAPLDSQHLTTSLYADTGHRGVACSEHHLVSYHLGDLAECWYRKTHGVSGDLQACLAEIRHAGVETECERTAKTLKATCP